MTLFLNKVLKACMRMRKTDGRTSMICNAVYKNGRLKIQKTVRAIHTDELVHFIIPGFEVLSRQPVAYPID